MSAKQKREASELADYTAETVIGVSSMAYKMPIGKKKPDASIVGGIVDGAMDIVTVPHGKKCSFESAKAELVHQSDKETSPC